MLQDLRIAPRFSAFAAALLGAAFLFVAGAAAQDAPALQLTEQQVKNFIAAQPEILATEGKFESSDDDKEDPKLLAALDAIAQKHGFKDIDELDEVGFAISWVLSGIDPETKRYSEAYIKRSLTEHMAEIRKDTSIPEKERQEMIQGLEEAIKNIQPVKDRKTIELIEKYYDQLDAVSL